MQVESFFEWLGQALGSVIRFIVDGLSGLFNILSDAGGNFVEGLAQVRWGWTRRSSASSR
jgi:hypothetical protein